MLNFLFRIISIVRRSYWFIFRPVTIGVKVILTAENKVLLIKNRYDKYWYLPGGGVKRGETIVECAKREMREEIGIELGELEILGIYSNFFEHKSDHIILLKADVTGQSLTKGLEIDQLELFDFKALPANISLATKRRLEEYQNDTISSGRW